MQHVGVDVDGLACDLVGPAAVVAEALDHGTDIALGHGDRLSVVERLDSGKQVSVLLCQVGELEDDLGTVLGRDAAPLALESLAGGLDGNVDILLGSLGHGGDDLFGGGVDDLEGLLVGTLNPFVVDEPASLWLASVQPDESMRPARDEGGADVQAGRLCVVAGDGRLQLDGETHDVSWSSRKASS